MPLAPSEYTLELTPSSRVDVIDVRRRVNDRFGDALDAYARVLCCSFHTTAGYLDQSLSVRLHHRDDLVAQFFRAFHALFPQGGEYRHDQMHLRSELSEEQKIVEPRNGDSHLTFIGAGMRNCVTYRTRPDAPVYFIELDGKSEALCRQRKTTVVAYDHDEVVARASVRIPVSKHPIDSINLADPKLGLLERVNELVARAGIEHARVDLVVDPSERNVGLTVNEYETLLMQHDLIDVLRNPLRFAKIKAGNMMSDPLAIPGKTLNYAKYDVVHVLNSLMEALRLDQGSFERLVAKVMSLPARRFLRSRRVSFLAGSDRNSQVPVMLRGTYQSPILVQWQLAEKQERHIDIVIVQFS